jgi:hypothetical protein
VLDAELEEKARLYGEDHGYWKSWTGLIFAPVLPSFQEHNPADLVPISTGWNNFYHTHAKTIEEWWTVTGRSRTKENRDEI